MKILGTDGNDLDLITVVGGFVELLDQSLPEPGIDHPADDGDANRLRRSAGQGRLGTTARSDDRSRQQNSAENRNELSCFHGTTSTISLPARVPSACSVASAVLDAIKRPLPSARQKFAPPGWQLP